MSAEPPPIDPTVLAGDVARWLSELVSVPLATVLAYLPRADGVPARAREQLVLAVGERDGGGPSTWVHGTWLAFLGDRDPDEALAPLFAYARSCAEHGRPLDTTTLDATFPPAVVRSVRATVARAQLEGLAGRALDDLGAVAGRRRRFGWGRVAADLAVVAGAVPFVVPLAAVAGTMWVADRLAPPLPPVIRPHRSNSLIVDLVAEAVPTYLEPTLVRSGLVWAPFAVSVAIRVEGQAATVTVGRGEIRVAEGIEPQALVVVDGALDALVPVAAGAIVGQLLEADDASRPA